ncbi:hypothetical protein EZV62_023872 [Acer yangbiense]|uniref:Uncharacterized protein n=1 Tax=Acer yangbiense TaxID=1000413 RepID=A0A5C7H318_9ROSI|nr:hypothetical protein EZV62_023872 [Acer yangbiense]
MASSSAAATFSLSLTTFTSQTKTSILSYKTNEIKHHLSSSVLGTKLCVNKVTRTMSLTSSRVTCSASSSSSSSSSVLPSALLFDCDGVLVDTEKDGHRISFNDTFTEKELGVTWDVDLYGELLKIGGGKERMTAYFNKTGWPEKAPKSEAERKEFIASLHKRKTELFMVLIEKKLLPLRPGVAKLVIISSSAYLCSGSIRFEGFPVRVYTAYLVFHVVERQLIDQALEKGVRVAVCSTSNEKADSLRGQAFTVSAIASLRSGSRVSAIVSAIVSFLLGPERADKIKIFAGDVVPRKKPDPAIYILAANTLDVDPSSCVVVEDSAIGLAAAKAAGMKCIVTKSGYTAEEDFLNADAVFDCIGDPPEERFDLSFCGSLLQKQYVS